MLGNLTNYLTEKDWEEITKRIEACVERVLIRHGVVARPLASFSTNIEADHTHITCRCGTNFQVTNGKIWATLPQK